jgi:signal transduction histidine kinase/CheY-like chemotaxis protein
MESPFESKSMTLPFPKETPQYWTGYGACVLAGVFLNIMPISVMFGVDFILGGIASLLAVVLYGPRLGALAALAISLVTIIKWGHPYYPAIAAAEAIFVGLTIKRFWNHVLLASAIYWVVPGAVLTIFFYGYALDTPAPATILVWLKHSINGISNALFASWILALYGVYRKKSQQGSISFDRAFFSILVAVIIIPTLTLFISTSRSKMEDLEKEIASKLQRKAESIQLMMSAWKRVRISALQDLAVEAGHRGVKYSPELQRYTELVHGAFSDFEGIYIADATGSAVAFDPIENSEGKNLIGTNFADREYFQIVKRTKDSYLSSLFMGRGSINGYAVSVSVPIIRNHQFLGLVNAACFPDSLNQALFGYVTEGNIAIAILDTKGMVVGSTFQNMTIGDQVERKLPGNIMQLDGANYRRMPEAAQSMPLMVRWRRSIYGTNQAIPQSDWRVMIEVPMEPYYAQLEAFYIESFGLMLALCCVGLIISLVSTKLVTKPIAQLAAVTTNLPTRVEDGSALSWPKSRLFELNSLIENFKYVTNALRLRFHELRLEVQERARTEQNLKQASEAAKAANFAKSAFLANMSHEIRTPLAAVLGFAEMLADPNLSRPEREEGLRAIERNSDQLLRLIDDILDFSKVEAGRLNFESVNVPLDEILAGGIEALQGKATEKNIQLLINNSTSVPDSFVTDPARLKQILLNLVGNAIKFTHQGQVNVDISFEKSEEKSKGTLTFRIRDTGIGLSEEQASHLFQPFRQADSSSTRRFGGTGLGLVLSRRIARCLGGDVTLVECQPNKGCIFQASVQVSLLPQVKMFASLAAARHSWAALETAHAKPGHSLTGLRILLVEDSPDNQLLIGKVLSQHGPIMKYASSGNEAVTMTNSDNFDVILMDVQMPGMDGLEATKIIRDRGFKGPVIALTAHALKEERQRCLMAGCNEHIAKPIDFPHLIDSIDRLVRAVRKAGLTPNPSH